MFYCIWRSLKKNRHATPSIYRVAKGLAAKRCNRWIEFGSPLKKHVLYVAEHNLSPVLGVYYIKWYIHIGKLHHLSVTALLKWFTSLSIMYSCNLLSKQKGFGESSFSCSSSFQMLSTQRISKTFYVEKQKPFSFWVIIYPPVTKYIHKAGRQFI